MKSKLSKTLVICGLALSFISTSIIIPKVVSATSITKTNAEQKITNFGSYTYPTDGKYYSSRGIENDLGDGLDGGLRKQISSKVYPNGWYTYSGKGSSTLSSVLQEADEDPSNSNNMIYLYTRDSVKKNAASSWNREHVWPQSLSGGNWGTGQAGADLLHIRPTYNSTNSTRGNDKYAELSKSSSTLRTYNGMDYGYKEGSYFMPLDSSKGDVARIIMYVWATYKDHYSNLPAITNVFKNYDTMMKWHIEDAPDTLEGNRNDFSETSKQKNRNPFVDHPEYAWHIFGNQCSAEVLKSAKEKYPDNTSTPVEPTSISIKNGSSLSLLKDESVQLELSFTPSNASEEVIYSSSNNSVVSVNQSGVIKGLSFGKATITVTSSLNASITSSIEVNVKKCTDVSLTGTLVKSSYIEGESFDPTGLKFIVTYSDDSTSLVDADKASWSPEILTLGVSKVTYTYEGFSGEYSPITVKARPAIKGYQLLNNLSNLHDGSSVIIASNDNDAVAGSLDKTFLKKVGATFSSDKTTLTSTSQDPLVFTVNKECLGDDVKYSFYTENGYLNSTQEKTIAFSSTSIYWSLSISGGICMMSVDDSSYLQYNSNSPKFTTYETPQDLIQLYYSFDEAEPTFDEEAENFANSFLDKTFESCLKLQQPASDIWNTLKEEYISLSNEAKLFFIDSSNSTIAGARERYILIVSKYQLLEKFIDGIDIPTSGIWAINFPGNNSDVYISILIICSAIVWNYIHQSGY